MTSGKVPQEELRLALVMNGGVSLAVWIGGATREIARLVSGVSAYGELAALTGTIPRVDVISGTSAGGVNGAYLALALAYHRAGPALESALVGLRELWVQKGSIEALLRSPFERNPPSFLDGDGYYYGALRDAFATVKGQVVPTSESEVPIDLVITTTLLRGRPQTYVDDFGSRVRDVTHRGQFRFSRGPDAEADPFADPDIADRLALAARCTSSFPAAFEPSFCPIGESTTNPRRPDMKDFATFDESGFVLDGGILDNKPLDVALDRIFRQRAEGPARRVLVYIVPDPETTTDGSATNDKAGAAPSLLDVALASLVQIPAVQSISAQLEALRTHNDNVRQRRRARVLLTRFNTPAEIDSLAVTLFEAYREGRVALAIDYIISEINKGLLQKPSARPLGHRGRREWLYRQIYDSKDELPFVPRTPPGHPGAAGERGVGSWRWGMRPLEHLARVVLDIVIRAQQLALLVDPPPDLSEFWKEAFHLIEESEQLRNEDRGYWRDQSAKAIEFLGPGRGGGPVAEGAESWLATALAQWRSATFETAAANLAQRMAVTLQGMRVAIAPALASAAGHSSPATRQQASDLAKLLGYFVRSDEDTSDGVVDRLLAFEVVQEALGGRGTLSEEEVEFVQLSGEGTATLGGPSRAADKLAGVQLAHFGAFYKSSWRANDWLWGRLDAARRLVRLLLDPERLARVARYLPPDGPPSHAIGAAIEKIALAAADTADPSLQGELEKRFRRADLDAELAYLDDPARPVPERLSVAVAAVTRRLEFEILRQELPLVASAIEDDRRTGAHPSAEATAFARRCSDASAGGGPLRADQVPVLLMLCQLGRERFRSELGTDRATAAAARTAAVAVAAVGRQEGWLETLGDLFGLLRAPTLLFHAFARNAHLGSRTGLAINVGAFVAGLAVVGTAVFASPAYPTGVVAAASAALVASLVLFVLRMPEWLRGALVLAAALLFGAGVATGLVAFPDFTLETWRTLAIVELAVVALIVVGRRL